MAIVEKTTVSVTVYVSAAAFVMVSCASQGSDIRGRLIAEGEVGGRVMDNGRRRFNKIRAEYFDVIPTT